MALPTKPFQIIVLAGFVIAALAGLFLFANFGGFGGSAKSVGAVTIWGTLPADAIAPQLNALKAAHKEYSGVSYAARPAATFDTDLAEALAAGTGPDLVLISQEQLLADRNKLSIIPFSSVPQRTYLDSFVPISELFLTDKGTYGLPLAVDPLVLYYNRTIFASAGIASAPSTWEAVTGLAGKLTQRSAGQIQRSAIALGVYGNIPNARAILSLLLLQSGTPITQVSAGSIRAALATSGTNDTVGVSSSESAVTFYTQFADPAKTVYSWNNALPDARQEFISGDLAMYVGFASEAPFLAAANPNLDFDMAAVPQPATSAARITYGHVFAFATTKASQNQTGALQAATILTSKDYAPAAARALSMAPAIRSQLLPAANDRFQPVFFPEALVAKGWLSPAPAVTDRIFAAMITNITTGLKGVREALTIADQALNASL